MIRKQLERAMLEQRILCIYVNGDTDDFWCGYVDEVTDELVRIRHLTKYGKPDGVIIERLENINSIDIDDVYANNMAYLTQNHHLLDEEEESIIQLPIGENWVFESLKQCIGKRTVVVRVILHSDDAFVGWVKELDDEGVMLDLLDQDGQADQQSVFLSEDIQTIRVNDIDARKRLLLYNWRQKK